MYVRLGGIDQWVQIRGDDRDNPVLLFVHGGPGNAVSPFASLFRPWERDFTIVVWDQRCAGKTYARSGVRSCDGLSLESFANDGIELSEFLRQRLHKSKIVVLGHSWGSMVALRMAHERPDVYSAYIGTGQVVSIPEKEPVVWDRAMALLRGAHDEAGVRALLAIGRPPYRSSDDLLTERNFSLRHDSPAERGLLGRLAAVGLTAPGWSLGTSINTFRLAHMRRMPRTLQRPTMTRATSATRLQFQFSSLTARTTTSRRRRWPNDTWSASRRPRPNSSPCRELDTRRS